MKRFLLVTLILAALGGAHSQQAWQYMQIQWADNGAIGVITPARLNWYTGSDMEERRTKAFRAYGVPADAPSHPLSIVNALSAQGWEVVNLSMPHERMWVYLLRRAIP